MSLKSGDSLIIQRSSLSDAIQQLTFAEKKIETLLKKLYKYTFCDVINLIMM